VPQEFIVSEFLVDKPKYTINRHSSIEEINEENRNEARLKVNLGPQSSEKIMKLNVKDPSTKYVENPISKTQFEWKESMKNEKILFNLVQSTDKFSQ